jgi:hypothetical protein
MTLRDHYIPVNTTFPMDLPPITKVEARRAAGRIIRHFTGKARAVDTVRRCWIAVRPPYNDLNRGWRRLIHDVSHTIMYRRGQAKPHTGVHAKLELEVARYVLEKGWLTGTLKPAPVVSVKLSVSDKQAHLEALLGRWQTKQRRCQTAIKKLNKRIRYYQRLEQKERTS